MPKNPVLTSVTPPGPIDVAPGATSPSIAVVGKEYDLEQYDVSLRHKVTGLQSEPAVIEFNLEDTTPEDLEVVVTPKGTGYRGVVTINQAALSFTVGNP